MDIRVPVDFLSVVADRLVASGASAPERHAALAVCAVISANLITQSLGCRQSASDLAERLKMPRGEFIAAAKLLAACGAITIGHAPPLQHRIYLTPPGVAPRRGPTMARRPLARSGVSAV